MTMAVQKSSFRVEDIRVTICNVEGEVDADVRAFALHAAHETPASTFGSRIQRCGNIAIVSIHRD